MISDLAIQVSGSGTESTALVPHGTQGVIARTASGGFVQPVADVLAYLDKRAKRPDCEGEEKLLITLFEDGQKEVRDLVAACKFVQGLAKKGTSVQSACTSAISIYGKRIGKLTTFRAKYDLWAKAKDWVVLVNLAKAPGEWKPENRGLSDAFIDYCATKFAEYIRSDAKFQAIEAIKKIWRTGRDEYGNEFVIPGYEKNWSSRQRELYPDGWHYSNIMRQIKARGAFKKSVEAALHQGTAAAMEVLPQQLRTRKDLRFMEEVTFDDVRTDFLIFDPATGQPCEMWLLVARDRATTMILGYVAHPACLKEDGTNSHLGLKEMKQLAAWLLERYPLPKDYIVHWIVERGTATLSEGSARALAEMLPNRIQVHFTSMLGNKSAVGYAEKKKGNSRGKGSHESLNRVIHTQGAYIPGQTGSRYDIRPADLSAKRKDGSGRGRVEECIEFWELRNLLPEHLREQVKYPLFTLTEARQHLNRIFEAQNFRDKHAIEGFETVLEWFDAGAGQWKDRTAWDGASEVKWNKRKERPVERAARLVAGHEWEFATTDVIVAFLKHTVKARRVEADGEFKLTHDGTVMIFAPALNAVLPAEQLEVLCYVSDVEPDFMHVTSGRGQIFGTWYRRGRNASRNEELLKASFRYTAAAMAATKERAEQLATPQRERLEAIRAHNAELERGNDFVEIAKPELAVARTKIHDPIARALANAMPSGKKQAQQEKDADADYERIAREALNNNHG